MIWFEIPIELSRSELPDVTIRVRCWRSSRIGSLSGSWRAFILNSEVDLP